MIIPERAALFPLNTVIFPGCHLPLQIFEQRYLRLVKECMRDDSGFVVVLISNGNEVGKAPEVFSIGTWVRITDWEALDNGLLGITITAVDRVHVDQPGTQHDGLLTAAVHGLPDNQTEPTLLAEYQDLADTLKQLQQHEYSQRLGLEVDYDDMSDICNKLSFLLPVSGLDKQTLLETNDLAEHCSLLRNAIARLQNAGQN